MARLGTPGVVRKSAITVLLAMATIVAALGYWGWTIFESEQPDIEFDWWTRLYRTQTLFSAEDGSLLKVPWPLDVARLLAPFVFLGFGALALFNLASVKVQRIGVRHAKGHVLYLGQPARLDRLRGLFDNELEPSVAVYGVPDAASVDGACLRISVDLEEDEWPTRTSAEHADTIVIAVHDDDRAVALATLSAERFPDTRLVVDVGSADTMRWLGLWMMTRYPGQDLRVISIDQADARVQAGLSDAARYDAVVVAGGDDGASRIVTEVMDQMMEWTVNESSRVTRPLLFIIGDGDPGIRSDVNDAVVVEVGSLDRAIEACTGLSTRVLALGRSGMKTAMKVAAAVPRSEFARLDTDGFDGRQLREMVERGNLDSVLDGLLQGPLHLLVASASSIENQSIPTRMQVEHQARTYAHRVSTLWKERWQITVSPSAPPYLPEAVVERIARELELPEDPEFRSSRALVHGLSEAGYGVVAPDETPAGVDEQAEVASLVLSDGDDLIEQVAKYNHELYRKAVSGSGNPSDVPWNDLSPGLHQQNYRQVRHIIDFLESTGLRVESTRGELSGSIVDEVPEFELHAFGRIEHDRWARDKIAQGFVWGPTRNLDSSPKTHPDLTDYDDLDDETKQKDYEPLLRAIGALRSADYRLVRPRQHSLRGPTLGTR